MCTSVVAVGAVNSAPEKQLCLDQQLSRKDLCSAGGDWRGEDPDVLQGPTRGGRRLSCSRMRRSGCTLALTVLRGQCGVLREMPHDLIYVLKDHFPGLWGQAGQRGRRPSKTIRWPGEEACLGPGQPRGWRRQMLQPDPSEAL